MYVKKLSLAWVFFLPGEQNTFALALTQHLRTILLLRFYSLVIYGGGSFELNPPRVTTSYGQLLEGLLASSPMRVVDRLLSPGILKIVLEPPIPVERVAAASVAGALGRLPVTPVTEQLDTYDKIKQAAKLLTAEQPV